eukprot:scaffold11.g4001.t1
MAALLQHAGRRAAAAAALAEAAAAPALSRALYAHAPAAAEAPPPPEASPKLVERLTADIKDPIQKQRLQDALRLPDEDARDLELYRLHNSSMDFQGHMILARVVEVDRKRVLMDTGLRLARMLRSELVPGSVVGSLERPDSQQQPRTPDERGRGPNMPGEVRVGDILRVYLEEAFTPESDSIVGSRQAAVELRHQAVWKELEARMRDKQTVKGRILNQLAGGYSVGIGGLVAFCPAHYCAPQTAKRVGELQDFRILVMKKHRNNVTVADARVDVDALQEKFRAHRAAQAAGRSPRDAKPSRQEVLQAGAELRQVLEIRDSTPLQDAPLPATTA